MCVLQFFTALTITSSKKEVILDHQGLCVARLTSFYDLGSKKKPSGADWSLNNHLISAENVGCALIRACAAIRTNTVNII